MPAFQASVQYGDFEGTAAADRADNGDISDFLKDNGHIDQDDFVVGAELWVGENHGGKLGHVSIKAFVSDAGSFDAFKAALGSGKPPLVRVVDIQITIEEFVCLFKRFSVVLTARGLNLPGKEYQEA